MRYSFYIDGFNVYYSLNTARYRKYKWLNYRAIAERYISSADTISKICYFTTYVKWKPDAVARHQKYIKALRSVGVETVLGRFMKKQTRCHVCRQYYHTREEKQTDVNIALRVVRDAVEDDYDRAFIVSGDTDLISIQA